MISSRKTVVEVQRTTKQALFQRLTAHCAPCRFTTSMRWQKMGGSGGGADTESPETEKKWRDGGILFFFRQAHQNHTKPKLVRPVRLKPKGKPPLWNMVNAFLPMLLALSTASTLNRTVLDNGLHSTIEGGCVSKTASHQGAGERIGEGDQKGKGEGRGRRRDWAHRHWPTVTMSPSL